MSFHGALTEAALRDGNTPEQFRVAAQRHANAFWFYTAIGAGIWYFLSWHWALIPFGVAFFVAFQSVSSTLVARKPEQRAAKAHVPSRFDLNDPAHVVMVDEIRGQYSALLADDSHPYSQCIYRPSSLLPYPKEVIRRALTALLDFVEGRRDSYLLDEGLRQPDVAEMIRTTLETLDDFLDVTPQKLPTDPRENARIAYQLQREHR
jgi:hypothetical protein